MILLEITSYLLFWEMIMREHKYRAYDKQKKEWITKPIAINYDGAVLLFTDYEILHPKNSDDIIVMQFTGLKDCNGKDIYDGDIVKITDYDYKICDLDSNTGFGKVEFLEDNGLWYISDNIHNGLFDIDKEYIIEAVGNIYDDPELLEGAIR